MNSLSDSPEMSDGNIIFKSLRRSGYIEKLIDMAPQTALVEVGGAETEIPVEQVKSGDILWFKASHGVHLEEIIKRIYEEC